MLITELPSVGMNGGNVRHFEDDALASWAVLRGLGGASPCGNESWAESGRNSYKEQTAPCFQTTPRTRLGDEFRVAASAVFAWSHMREP